MNGSASHEMWLLGIQAIADVNSGRVKHDKLEAIILPEGVTSEVLAEFDGLKEWRSTGHSEVSFPSSFYPALSAFIDTCF